MPKSSANDRGRPIGGDTHPVRRKDNMQIRTSRPLVAALIVAGVLMPGAAWAATTKLTISYSQKTVDFAPLLIASDAGYFKQRGLDVTVRYLPAQEGIPAIIAGQEEIGGFGGADGASADAAGAKLKLVVTLTPTYLFQLWAHKQYASPAELKGQRVGITSTTGSLYAATLLALKQLGLKKSDVIMTPLGGVTNVNSSLLAGSVAAALSHPPATYQFQRAGLVDLVDMAKSRIPSVNAGIWVTQSYIDTHREVVQNVVDALVQGFQREKSDRAFAESEYTKYLGVKDKGELDFTYDFYVNEVLAPTPMPQAAEIQSNIEALAPSNPKVKNLNAAAVIDQSFVATAVKAQPPATNGTAANPKGQ
jgi:NitT/TauT family transport system substrate-binding protein